jgi:exodeoxyribonuclease V gamma subunit
MEYAHKQEWRLDKARKRWTDSHYLTGEGEDPYYRICFGESDPFNEDFEGTARKLLGPMLQHEV